MAYISLEEIQKYVDSLNNHNQEIVTPAKDCLVIKFKDGFEDEIFDEERINEVLDVESRNGHVTISFDKYGYLKSIEIS